MRESEREMGGLREGKDRGCGKGEKNVMLQLQFWVDSQKRSRTESERRGETGCNWSTRRATQTGEGVRYMLSLTHSSFPSPSFLISDRAAP